MEQFIKTANEVAEQIERWFLLYHKKEKPAFNGSEAFTIFNHLYYEQQNDLIRRMQLNKYEIPVLVLKLRDNGFLINTTERFLLPGHPATESVYYADFKWHKGFKPPSLENRTNVKLHGSYADFGLQKQNDEIVYWSLPAGKPGFAFWNVTKKFHIIGRKYIIKDYDNT